MSFLTEVEEARPAFGTSPRPVKDAGILDDVGVVVEPVADGEGSDAAIIFEAGFATDAG